MKKLIVLMLALAMVFSIAGCHEHHWEAATCVSPKICNDCDATEGAPLGHTPGQLAVSAVDPAALTMTHELPCSTCGAVIETKTSATGIAPVDGKVHVSPEEWYACLSTNIQLLGAGQTLIPYPPESQDDTLMHGLVSMSHMLVVFTYQDSAGNVITTEGKDGRGSIHNIRVDAQFTNDNAREFFMLLMLLLVNNNAALELDAANTLASQIMSGNAVTDNGFTYAMEVISAADHTVCVSITAQ